jgi:hypothetical protein
MHLIKRALNLLISPSQVRDLLNQWRGLRQQELVPAAARGRAAADNKPSPVLNSFLDGHFPVQENDTDQFHFFGSSSVLVFGAQLLSVACPNSRLLEPANPRQSSTPKPRINVVADSEILRLSLSRSLIEQLFDIFNTSLMGFWPFRLQPYSKNDLDVFLEFVASGTTTPMNFTSDRVHQIFRVAIVCTIAAAHNQRSNPELVVYERRFYRHALGCVKVVFSEATHQTLQGLILLIIYLLFRPRKGDIWLLLESACRLAIELGYHREAMSQPEDLEQKVWRSRTFWSLYRLERSICEIFGRPSNDLESIITVGMPGDMQAAFPFASLGGAIDSVAASLARVSRLRTDIFNALYLPANTFLDYDESMYADYIGKLDRWYSEAVAVATFSRLNSTIIQIAYHGSVLFISQPFLLRILSRPDSGPNGISPLETSRRSQHLQSACQLIRHYEEILLLRRDDEDLVHYPITFISGHEIFSSGLTLLAYCLCSLDRGMKLPAFDIENSITLKADDSGMLSSLGNSQIWTELYMVSATCMSLLTWCSTQWQGMDGMLEIYREVSSTVFIPEARLGGEG